MKNNPIGNKSQQQDYASNFYASLNADKKQKQLEEMSKNLRKQKELEKKKRLKKEERISKIDNKSFQSHQKQEKGFFEKLWGFLPFS